MVAGHDVYPHCPCSRAAFGELAELTRTTPVPFGVEVVFVSPPGAEDGWERSESWASAAAVPGCRVRHDAGGVEAQRAGAATSGHVTLIDPAGRVVYRGGITRGRGRAGESAGRRAVLDALAGGAVNADGPVFGCPLFDEGTGTETANGGRS